MAERGLLGARQMYVPLDEEAVYQQPQQQAAAANDYQIPVDTKDPLAVRRKLTADYYNNYALLQRIVKDAAAQGIDPFQPDYSQDGGGLAFQMAQEAEANVMFAANFLQNEFQKEKQVTEARLRGDARNRSDFDPTSQMYTTTPDAFYSTKLDPRIAAANARTAQSVFTDQDATDVNTAVFDPTKTAIQGDRNLGAEERAYQLSGLFPSVAETNPYSLRPPANQKIPHEVEILKKVTNVTQGVWPEGTYNLTTKGGKALLENKTYSGDFFGEYEGVDNNGNKKVYKKILKRWLKDPETGEVLAEYTDPNIPIEIASNATGDTYAAAVISNNPKYGDVAKMYSGARELGLLDDTSSARNEALISQDADTLRQSAASKAKGESGVAEKYNVVKNELTKLTNDWFGHNTKIYSLPDGRQLKIGKHKVGEGFFIDNWKELGYKEADLSRLEHLTLDQALAFLDDFNYFDKFLGQRSAPQIDPDI